MREEKPSLWKNIRDRRKKGLRPKRPGEKGYPKTLDIEESVLRSVIRNQIIAHSLRSGKRFTEGSEMFAGRDLEQMQISEFLAALETAEMDLEDAGCPDDSDARVILFQAMEMIDKGRERPDFGPQSLVSIASEVTSAIRSCEHIGEDVAESVASDIESALDRAQESDRY
jgi:hypothetical protein